MVQSIKTEVLVLGGGTAGSAAVRTIKQTKPETQIIQVYLPELKNTCVEAGCMPSKSILAGAKYGESLATIRTTKDTHIDRLRQALTDHSDDNTTVLIGTISWQDNHTVTVETAAGTYHIKADKIILTTGSKPFIPPIDGLDINHPQIWTSDDVVRTADKVEKIPQRLLVIGAGPIGLELATFFNRLGSDVQILQRGPLLSSYDPEVANERLRMSHEVPDAVPIHCHSTLQAVTATNDRLRCTISYNGQEEVVDFDAILVATGRRANTHDMTIEQTDITLDERDAPTHNKYLQSTVPHIYIAGDVAGHHQILHYATHMGTIAGHNAVNDEQRPVDFATISFAVSFDEFPSAQVGFTENAAREAGYEPCSATRYFNEIGIGILKRHTYGLWKLVADRHTGEILGTQIVGPEVTPELAHLIAMARHNQNSVRDLCAMTWYHPTYSEILLSLARDITSQQDHDSTT